LLEDPGELVAREELRRRLWPRFSSNVSHVAFASGGEKEDNFDICIAMVGHRTFGG
jgi:hypothetical protein